MTESYSQEVAITTSSFAINPKFSCEHLMYTLFPYKGAVIKDVSYLLGFIIEIISVFASMLIMPEPPY
jgi:hypothetical protein